LYKGENKFENASLSREHLIKNWNVGLLADSHNFVDAGLLDYDTVWNCRWVYTFWKSILPPFSGLN
jgi:hypothetical protein